MRRCAMYFVYGATAGDNNGHIDGVLVAVLVAVLVPVLAAVSAAKSLAILPADPQTFCRPAELGLWPMCVRTCLRTLHTVVRL